MTSQYCRTVVCRASRAAKEVGQAISACTLDGRGMWPLPREVRKL